MKSVAIKHGLFPPPIGHLICPCCGGEYLHHVSVTVFDRGEDAEQVRKVGIGKGTLTANLVPNEGSGNPSRRRHGMTITFWCEGCAETFEGEPVRLMDLTISQHKGNTEIAWSEPYANPN